MSRSRAVCALLSAAAIAVAGVAETGPQASDAGLTLVQTIPLEHVEGRIDHLAADLDGKRLLVAALGNNTLEIVDVEAGKVSATVRGLREPQGVAYLPSAKRIIVANGGDGAVDIFDGVSLKPLARTPLGDDADNVRVDRDGRVYVGYGSGAIAELNPQDGRSVASTKLGGHPESFQLESSGSRAFVNVPDAGQVAVVDRARHATLATWPVTRAAANFPMALDEARRRLFIGCRRPARVLVYDLDSGALVAEMPTVGDTDDLFFDSARRQLYVSGGEGAVDVIRQATADRYEARGRVPTASGARTSLFVPAWNRLFVARPHRGAAGAAILVFSTE